MLAVLPVTLEGVLTVGLGKLQAEAAAAGKGETVEDANVGAEDINARDGEDGAEGSGELVRVLSSVIAESLGKELEGNDGLRVLLRVKGVGSLPEPVSIDVTINSGEEEPAELSCPTT